MTFFYFLTVSQVQSPIRKSPQQTQGFMFKVIWLPTFHSLNAQTHLFCTDASTVNIYRLVPVHRQIKCLMINRNMIFELTVASCCLKTPWWYFWFIFVASLLFNMPLFYSFNFYGHFFFLINCVNLLYQKLIIILTLRACKNKPKCIMGIFRKGTRLVLSPQCLGLFNPDFMHRL